MKILEAAYITVGQATSATFFFSRVKWISRKPDQEEDPCFAFEQLSELPESTANNPSLPVLVRSSVVVVCEYKTHRTMLLQMPIQCFSVAASAAPGSSSSFNRLPPASIDERPCSCLAQPPPSRLNHSLPALRTMSSGSQTAMRILTKLPEPRKGDASKLLLVTTWEANSSLSPLRVSRDR
jgi:hypothetical protein